MPVQDWVDNTMVFMEAEMWRVCDELEISGFKYEGVN
jgi:hypothetical protein